MESLNQFPEDVAPSALQVSFGIKALTHSILHIFYSFLSLLASYFWHASIIPLFNRLCFYVLLAFLCSFCLSHILLFLVDWVVKRKYFLPVTTPYSGSTVDRAFVLHDPADHNKAWARISIPIPIS